MPYTQQLLKILLRKGISLSHDLGDSVIIIVNSNNFVLMKSDNFNVMIKAFNLSASM